MIEQTKTQPINEISTKETSPRQVSFAEAFRFWLKLGFISFGGPAGQIAIMHRELVENRSWLSEKRFLHALNYCMLLPGPEAKQLAIYIGWLMHRNIGGIIAGVFFVLPSIFLLLGLSYIYAKYGNLSVVIGILGGFKSVIVAVVIEAVLKIGGRALKKHVYFGIAAAGFIAIFFLHIPFPIIVLAAGLIGFIGANYFPESFDSETKINPKSDENLKPPTGKNQLSVIDDDVPPLPHTLPSRSRLFRVLIVGFVLWAIPFLAIILWRGSESIHAQEYRFFTQAALVTFGGAYAVLGYVTQTAVDFYHWLTPAQAVDGLALAETTPGPLIMVLQFVGFMAVWNNSSGANQLGDAILGAFLTTYVTFLPSFIFIFAGAPYIEILRGNKSLAGVLNCITAAVVGVILNLALIFGAAVIFPQGLSGKIEWLNAGLSIVAFILLYRFKINVLWIIFGGGMIGLGSIVLFG